MLISDVRPALVQVCSAEVPVEERCWVSLYPTLDPALLSSADLEQRRAAARARRRQELRALRTAQRARQPSNRELCSLHRIILLMVGHILLSLNRPRHTGLESV